MSNSTGSPDAFSNIETLTAALSEATTIEEQRTYFRAIARAFEVLIGRTHTAIHGVVDAVTPKASENRNER
jgi:hypothetical protein